MLRSIDSCQNRASADQRHMATFCEQFYNSLRWRGFLKFSANQLWFSIDRKVDKYFQEEFEQRICQLFRKVFLKTPTRASLLILS